METKTPEPEQKSEDGKAPEPKKDEPKTGAPEKYEFKLPDGVELKPDTFDKASTIFKELGLTQDAAQKIVDLHIAELAAAAEGPVSAYNEMREGWKTAAKADPDIGPKQAKIQETIGRAYDILGDTKLVADFKEAMNLTGVGDHPAFIKVLNKWAEALIEPRNVLGKGPSEHGQNSKGQNERPNAAAAMYPNLPA